MKWRKKTKKRTKSKNKIQHLDTNSLDDDEVENAVLSSLVILYYFILHDSFHVMSVVWGWSDVSNLFCFPFYFSLSHWIAHAYWSNKKQLLGWEPFEKNFFFRKLSILKIQTNGGSRREKNNSERKTLLLNFRKDIFFFCGAGGEVTGEIWL